MHVFILSYKEMCWLKFSCVAVVLYTLHVYFGEIEKDHVTIITAFSLKNNICMQNFLYALSLISGYTKIRKPVSKETFAETSKVVNKPLKVINN